MIIKIIDNVSNNYYGRDSLCPTGPGLFGEIVNNTYLKPCGFFDNNYYYDNILGKIIQHKCDECSKDQYWENGNSYYKLWVKKEIYNKNCNSISNQLSETLINSDINQYDNEIDSILNLIHNKLKIKYGNFKDELPEQKMVIRYLNKDDKVLEIGGNIGRNSLVIASIINNDNFVSLECDVDVAKQLEENRNLNNFTFHIENSALSKMKLIQKGWDTKPSDILENGYKWVNIINLDDLINKYKIDFDTLVLDCEGAFYYILKDMPEILNNIKLIIMENDYHDISHKNYVDSILKKYNFYNDYKEVGGWGCCYNNFFEVWKKYNDNIY